MYDGPAPRMDCHSLGYNKIGVEGMRALAASLPRCSALKELRCVAVVCVADGANLPRLTPPARCMNPRVGICM